MGGARSGQARAVGASPERLHGRSPLLTAGLVALTSARPLVVLGAPGSGRTAVLRSVAARWEDTGGRARHLAGREVVAGVPLAPAAPLVAEAGLVDCAPIEVFTRLPVWVAEQQLLIVLDDVDVADRATAVLATQLVRAGVCVALSAQSDAAIPHGLQDALLGAGGELLTLDPLNIDEIAALAADHLGDELSVQSLARTVVASGGLPERVLELVEAGRDGAVSSDAGIQLSARVLTDVLRTRVESLLTPLAPEPRATAELVSAAGTFPERYADMAAADQSVVAGLLVRSVARSGEVLLSPADEVVRAAVLESMGSHRARTARGRARDLLRDVDPNAPEALARRALLCVTDAVPVPSADLLASAIHLLALGRYEEARQLIEASSEVDTAEYFLLRGRARAATGAPDAAAEDLGAAAARAGADLLPEIGHELGVLHAVRRGDAARAVREVSALADRLDTDRAQRLHADLVKWRLMSGEPAGVPTTPESAATSEAREQVELVGVAMIEAMIASMDGPVEQAREVVDHALGVVRTASVTPPHAEELLTLSHYLTTGFEGRLDEAHVLAMSLRDEALLHQRPAVGLWEFAAAELGMQAGNLFHSRALARRAVRHLAWQDFTGVLESARALTAVLEARCGDPAEALRIQRQLPPHAAQDVKVDLHLARLAVTLNPDAERVRALARVGHRAMAESHSHFGLLAVDEALILTPDPLERRTHVELLESNADRSPFFLALAVRGRAFHERDVRALEVAADDLLAVGCRGRALHSFQTAATWHLARGAREAARRLQERASTLTASGVHAWPTAPQPSELSARELEIARLAMGRARSREIAETLQLSVRTVDNHLSKIFRKLGVSSRGELAEALADRPVAAVDRPTMPAE